MENHKYTLQDNMQGKFFSLTQGIVAQNNTLQQFIKQSVMKQFQNIRSRDDWTQRYIDQIGQKLNQATQTLHQILQRLSKPFLSKDVAKWLFQIVMQLHIRKTLDYLLIVKQRYTSTCNKDILSHDLYRTFRQITRQQMQFMNNFKTHYGQYGKVLKDVLQPQNFWKFIKQGILPTLQKQKQQMVKQAQIVMLSYKDQLMKYIQDK